MPFWRALNSGLKTGLILFRMISNHNLKWQFQFFFLPEIWSWLLKRFHRRFCTFFSRVFFCLLFLKFLSCFNFNRVSNINFTDSVQKLFQKSQNYLWGTVKSGCLAPKLVTPLKSKHQDWEDDRNLNLFCKQELRAKLSRFYISNFGQDCLSLVTKIWWIWLIREIVTFSLFFLTKNIQFLSEIWDIESTQLCSQLLFTKQIEIPMALA